MKSTRRSGFDLGDDLAIFVSCGRFEYVRFVLTLLSDAGFRTDALRALERWSPSTDEQRAETRKALAPLLAVMQKTGASTSWGDGASIEWRVCDVAAERLAAWFAGSIAFDPKLKEAERDAQIAKIAEWARK